MPVWTGSSSAGDWPESSGRHHIGMVTRCGQPGRTGPDWSDWARLGGTGRTGPDWAGLDQTGRTGPDWSDWARLVGLGQTGRTEPDWADWVRLDQLGKTGPTGLTGMRTEVNVQFAEPKELNVETKRYKKTTICRT